MVDSNLKQVLNVNTNGALYTAQAVGQQMEKFGNGGSLILIASIGGHRADKVYPPRILSWKSTNNDTLFLGYELHQLLFIQVRSLADGQEPGM